LDHDESVRARDWDDVVEFPVVDMPDVVSPAKPSGTECPPHCDVDPGAPVPLQVVYAYTNEVIDEDCIGSRTRQRKRKCSVFDVSDGEAEDDKESDLDKDSYFDPDDIVDSDVDISEDDDDLFEDNVEEEEQGKK
jgi:hypothetical protein